MDELQKLLDKRNKALAECRRIKGEVDTANKADPTKGWSAEQRQEFDRWATEAKDTKRQYDEKLADQNRGSWLTDQDDTDGQPANRRVTDPSSHRDTDPNNNGKPGKPRILNWNPCKDTQDIRPGARAHDRKIELKGPRAEENYRKAYARYLKTGKTDGFEKARIDNEIYNALRSDDEEQGGYLVAAEEFMGGLLKSVDDATYIQGLARVLIVRGSRSLGIRKRTARINTIRKGSELGDITKSFDESYRLGKRALTPHYYVGGIQVSRDFMRMSVMDPEQIIQDEMSYHMASFNEQEFLYGDGREGALGIMVPSNLGLPTSRDIAVVASDINLDGGTNQAVTSDYGFKTLTRAKFNQKLQYRNRSRWMFNRDHIAYINNITDRNGQFIFQQSKQVGEPDRLLGLAVDESEWMPGTFTTGTYLGILACWEHYLIVYGLELEVQRLNEIAARSNQIEYHFRYKMDANIDLEEAFTRIKFG